MTMEALKEKTGMADNPLFYRNIVTLNRDQHKSLKVDLGSERYGFARGAHMIPAVIDEFFAGGRTFPIVFVQGPNGATPVFITGFEPGQNLFVGLNGEWTGDYIPAFLRRYPFIVGEVEGHSSLICVDDASDALSKDRGEALFLESGEDAPHLKDVVKLTGDYLAAANRTVAFVDALRANDLFNTVTISVRASDTSKRTIHGAMSIDVTKFDALPDATVLDLRKKGFLQAIYSQISSLALVERLAAAERKGRTIETSASGSLNASHLDATESNTSDLLN